MRFSQPLLRGRLLRRYKRFLVDIALEDGVVITAHTPNPGSMRTCLEPASPAYFSKAKNPKRKLPYTWELCTSVGSLVGINPLRANALVEEAIRAGRIPELVGYPTLRREVRYGQNSRIDLLLEDARRPPHYVEVKSVSMGREGVAGFPDAVSVRGTKHMLELAAQVREGAAATVFFAVQRSDCHLFRPADDIDPAYGDALRAAAAAGVNVLAYRTQLSPQEIWLSAPLPIQC